MERKVFTAANKNNIMHNIRDEFFKGSLVIMNPQLDSESMYILPRCALGWQLTSWEKIIDNAEKVKYARCVWHKLKDELDQNCILRECNWYNILYNKTGKITVNVYYLESE